MQIEKYKQRERNRVGDSTLQSRLSAIRQFDQFTGKEEPSVDDIEDWIDHLIEKHEQGEIKASTIRQYFKSVKYYFKTVHGADDEDFSHISKWIPESDVDHGEYLTVEEWEKLRNNVYNLRNRAMLETMYWYARRPGEVRLLNEEDVDLEEGTIRFNILKKKEDDRGQPLPTLKLKRDREVYEEHKVFRATYELVDDVRDALEKMMEHSDGRTETIEYDGEEMEVTPLFSANYPRITYDAVWSMIKREAERAGIDKNITPKSQRHSRTTHLDWAGHEPGAIARQQLIHDPDSDVVGSYIHPRDEEQVREVMRGDES